MTQALNLSVDLTLLKDGQDFVQSFASTATVEEGFVQIVECDGDGVTVDLTNFTSLEAIGIYNRDSVTLAHAEYTYRWESLSFDANALSFTANAGLPDNIDALTGTTLLTGFVKGQYARVVGSTENDGVYLVTSVAPGASTFGQLTLPNSILLTTRNPEPNAVTIHKEVRNRTPIGPREFHLFSGHNLYLPDELVLRTRVQQPRVTCEVWVFGT